MACNDLNIKFRKCKPSKYPRIYSSVFWVLWEKFYALFVRRCKDAFLASRLILVITRNRVDGSNDIQQKTPTRIRRPHKKDHCSDVFTAVRTRWTRNKVLHSHVSVKTKRFTIRNSLNCLRLRMLTTHNLQCNVIRGFGGFVHVPRTTRTHLLSFVFVIII